MPEKEELYISLNIGDIIDTDYMYVKSACKDYEIKTLGEYIELYLNSDILLYHLDLANFYQLQN